MFWKWLKRIGLIVLCLPVMLVILFVIYEIFGMCVNHVATGRQTDRMQASLECEIPDIEIISVYSETGNTSGTGNHVDCLSSIEFLTEMKEDEIRERMSEYYEIDQWSCSLNKTGDRQYLFYLNTSAPFADNIEGH